jgi:DNA-binding XRE family transcriptional regulator
MDLTPPRRRIVEELACSRPQYFPAIIKFLGYIPLPPAKTWAERLVRGRTAQGWSQKAFAQKMEVDPSTLTKWERGEREPVGACAARAERFLSAVALPSMKRRRAG